MLVFVHHACVCSQIEQTVNCHPSKDNTDYLFYLHWSVVQLVAQCIYWSIRHLGEIKTTILFFGLEYGTGTDTLIRVIVGSLFKSSLFFTRKGLSG